MTEAPLDKTVDEGEDNHDTSETTASEVVWGRLISQTPGVKSVDLSTDGWLWIGRNKKECDERCVFEDKRISAKHCGIHKQRNEAGETTVYLLDNSSNGTFVNGKKVGKGNLVALNSGDEICLVNSKEGKKIAYIWKQLAQQPASPANPSEGRDKPTAADTPPAPTATTTITTTVTTATTTTTAPAVPTDSHKRKAPDNVTEEDEREREAKRLKLAKFDALEEGLVCGICHDIMYKCVSVLPCLHNFCASCLSEWLVRARRCPDCRAKVKAAKKNHALAAVIDTYLEAHPEKKRPPEDYKDMDERCTLTDEMLRDGKLPSTAAEYDEADDDNEVEAEDGSGSDSDAASPTVAPAPAFGFWMAGTAAPAPMFDFRTSFRPRCRHCTSPSPDGYRCSATATHLVCSVCSQPMPDRSDYAVPVKCAGCFKVFCDLYWGCSSPLGVGALKKLKDHHITAIPVGAFKGNAYEVQILREYLTAKGKTPDSMFHEIVEKLDSGAMSFTGLASGVEAKGSTYVCTTCAARVFEGLCYAYRAAIPAAELPAAVTSRSDCHWGKHCRTQTHNLDHARRYNHICEQTRF